MGLNKILTWLLIALLAGLLIIAGIETWKSRQARKQQQQEEAQMQRVMQDYGMIPQDTLDDMRNSSFSEADSTGIETGTADEINYGAPTPQATAPQPTAPAPVASNQALHDTPAKTPAQREFNADMDGRDGRYRVSAGSFTKMDGARRRLEQVIRMGYHEAEIGRYNRGKYAVVIVKRTDNLNEAIRIVDQLERKGIDANVIDHRRRK